MQEGMEDGTRKQGAPLSPLDLGFPFLHGCKHQDMCVCCPPVPELFQSACAWVTGQWGLQEPPVNFHFLPDPKHSLSSALNPRLVSFGPGHVG